MGSIFRKPRLRCSQLVAISAQNTRRSRCGGFVVIDNFRIFVVMTIFRW